MTNLSQAQATDWSWHQTITPHFTISHQMPWLPAGLSMSLERLHGRLRLDLASLSPWMSGERINLFIYKTQEGYVKGKFNPPPWSNGISLYRQKTVVVYDQADKNKLLEIIGHETTHLLFDSFWGASIAKSPAWLNEGLAMLEQNSPEEKPENSDWYRVMEEFPDQAMDMKKFFALNPSDDNNANGDQDKIARWYGQAYSVTFFLLRKQSRLQFKLFCSYLRDGKDLAQSLWLAYRFRSVNDFEKHWYVWVKDPAWRNHITGFNRDQEIAPIGAMKGFKPLKP